MVSRTRVRFGRLLCLAAGLAMAILVAGRAAGGEAGTVASGRPEARHLVRAGDTLWEIARARVGPAGDPRPLVQALREANGLGTGAVRVGEVLLVPETP